MSKKNTASLGINIGAITQQTLSTVVQDNQEYYETNVQREVISPKGTRKQQVETAVNNGSPVRNYKTSPSVKEKDTLAVKRQYDTASVRKPT